MVFMSEYTDDDVPPIDKFNEIMNKQNDVPDDNLEFDINILQQNKTVAEKTDDSDVNNYDINHAKEQDDVEKKDETINKDNPAIQHDQRSSDRVAFDALESERRSKSDNLSVQKKPNRWYLRCHYGLVRKEYGKSPGTLIALILLSSINGKECFVEVKLLQDSWKFGENVTLLCTYDEEAYTGAIWIKGYDKKHLTAENETKYEKYVPVLLKTGRKMAYYMYYLTITNFDMYDFGDYQCQFTFDHSNILSLNKTHLIDFSERDVRILDINIMENILEATYKIEKVFPKPSCRAMIQDSNLTRTQIMRTVREFDFYLIVMVRVEIPMTNTICHGNLNITCFVANEMFTDSKYFDFCEGKFTTSIESSNKPVIFVVPTTLALIVLSMLLLIAWKKRRNIKSEHHEYCKVLKQPDVNQCHAEKI